jgi:hypothetical protein
LLGGFEDVVDVHMRWWLGSKDRSLTERNSTPRQK